MNQKNTSNKPLFRDDNTELQKFMIAREDKENLEREHFKMYDILDIISNVLRFFTK